jgi:hypothetical protein
MTKLFFPENALVATLIFLLGLAIRIERLSTDPLWYDEGLTLLRIEGGSKAQFIHKLVTRSRINGDGIHFDDFQTVSPEGAKSSAQGSYMPVFYTLERGVSNLIGLKPHYLKLLPTIFGALLPLAVWSLLTAIMPGTRTGVLAALLTATHPLLVAYSVELRSYSLLLLCACVYLRVLLKPPRNPSTQFITLSVVVLLGAFTHLLFLPMAWIGWVLAYVNSAGEDRRSLRLSLLGLSTVSLAAVSRIALILSSGEARTHFTMRTTTLEHLSVEVTNSLALLEGIPSVAGSLGTWIILAVALLATVRMPDRLTRSMLLTLIAPFAGMLVVDLVSGGVRSTVPRYSASLAIFFPAVYAITIDRITGNARAFKAFLCVVVATLFCISSHHVDGIMKGGWYTELEWYRAEFHDKEALVLGPFTPSQLLGISLNGGQRTSTITVHGSASPQLTSEVTAALTRKIPVIGMAAVDGEPPNTPFGDWKWREVFRGPQASFFVLDS